MMPRAHRRTDTDKDRRRQLSPGVEHGCCKIHLDAQEPLDKRNALTRGSPTWGLDTRPQKYWAQGRAG